GRLPGRVDCDAVPERQRWVGETTGGELRQEPAIGKLVVQHDGVAGGVGAARDREVRPERAGVDGPEQAGPVLGVHGEGQVHNLDVVVRPDVAVGIGRVYAETKEVRIILIRQAFNCQQGTGYS